MTAIRCETCAWFKPDEHNPTAAMGECMHENKHGYWHAGKVHRCRDHEEVEGDDAATQA